MFNKRSISALIASASLPLSVLAAEKPLNIVLLYADDLGFGDMGSYNPDSKIPTPHTPIVPNDKFDDTSEAGAYGDFVVETDDSCGQLLTALREAGLDENTIILFTADNGSEA